MRKIIHTASGARFGGLILALLVSVSWVPSEGFTATNWSRLAVMPFHNVTGNKALDPWRESFASRVSNWAASAQPFQFDVCEVKEVLAALTNSGWRAEQEVTDGLARKVAVALRCSTVVLGEVSRADGLWKVRLRLVRPDSTEAESSFEVEDRSTHQLLLRLQEKTCSALGITPDAAGVALMHDYPISDSAIERLVMLGGSERENDTSPDYIQALRDILAAEPTYFAARSRLARALALAKKLDEALAEGRKLVQQAPGLCVGYLCVAWCLQGPDPEQEKQREEALLAALKAHPGCPGACRFLFAVWSQQERWEDIRRVATEAHKALPAETSTSAYLALARAKLGDRKGACAVLSEVDATGEEDEDIHSVLLQAGVQADLYVMARELLWMQRRSATNSAARDYLSQADASLWISVPGDWKPLTPPRTYTPLELQAELEKRLTPEERSWAASPIAVTKEIASTARQLTEGLTNAQVKAALLFAHVAEQRLKANAVYQQPHARTGPQQACHYYASQLAALARAIGIPAWLAHVEVNNEEGSGYHDRAALMVGGRLRQSDPTWEVLWMLGSEDQSCRILDDLQATAHHLCQTSSLPAVRAGLKLDPDDIWTRTVAVTKLAELGQPEEAETLWKSLPPECTNRWDYYLARGIIDAESEDYASALKSFLKANQLGPNNVQIEFNLGLVYGSLKDSRKAVEHMQKAMNLGAARHVSGDLEDLDTRFKVLSAATIRDDVPLDELRRRAAAGDLAARTALVNRLFKQGPREQEEALNLMRETAEEGNAVTQEEYARNLLILRGPKAAEEAVGFFRRAARQGNHEAQYQLGVIFYTGKFAPRNEVEASQWIHLAAQRGDKDARSVLKEMELFLDSTAFAEGKRRAADFKPVPEQRKSAQY